MTKFYCNSCWVWVIKDCECNFEWNNIRVKHKNSCTGSEQAAELLLSPLLTFMFNLLAFAGPGLMPLWIPLLDVSVAMAVHAIVIANSHLSFLASAPHSEKVHYDPDTNLRRSSDPHTVPNPGTWELPLTAPTATPDWLQQRQNLDKCILYKLHITVRRLCHTTLSDECIYVAEKLTNFPSSLPTFLPTFLSPSFPPSLPLSLQAVPLCQWPSCAQSCTHLLARSL